MTNVVPFPDPVADAIAEANEQYRDPMEEPDTGICGACGLYPLGVDEDHECPTPGDE